MVGDLHSGHDNINQEFESRAAAQTRLFMGERCVWQRWCGILPVPLAQSGPYGQLGRKVVNQTVRIFHVASWEVWLVLDDLTTILHEPPLGFFHTIARYLQNRPQRWPGLNE